MCEGISDVLMCVQWHPSRFKWKREGEESRGATDAIVMLLSSLLRRTCVNIISFCERGCSWELMSVPDPLRSRDCNARRLPSATTPALQCDMFSIK